MHFRSWVSKNPVVPLLLFGSTFGVAGYRYYNFTTSLDTIISDSKLRMQQENNTLRLAYLQELQQLRGQSGALNIKPTSHFYSLRGKVTVNSDNSVTIDSATIARKEVKPSVALYEKETQQGDLPVRVGTLGVLEKRNQVFASNQSVRGKYLVLEDHEDLIQGGVLIPDNSATV